MEDIEEKLHLFMTTELYNSSCFTDCAGVHPARV
jgi:hypothetical protein